MDYVVRLEAKDNPINIKTVQKWGKNPWIAVLEAFKTIPLECREAFILQDFEPVGKGQ